MNSATLRFDLAELILRNGSIIGDSTRSGVYCSGCAAVTVENVRIKDINYGMAIFSPNKFDIVRNVVDTANNYGIWIAGAAALTPASGTVVDNVVDSVGEHGILLDVEMNGISIRANRVRFAGLAGGLDKDGIKVLTSGPVELIENQVSDVLGTGIYAVVEGGKIEDNIVELAGADGLFVSSPTPGSKTSCRIVGNVLSLDAGSGLRTDSDGNQISDNVLNANANHGLLFEATADQNSYQGNVIVDNVTTCVTDSGTGNVSLAANLLTGSPAGCP